MAERDQHLRIHDRPYKCDKPNCDFSHMGFASKARLNVHLQYHENQRKVSVAHVADIDNNDDVELILLDAVKADDLDLVREFIADVPRYHGKVLRQAVDSSSCEMLEVLLDACKSGENVEPTILEYAVRADRLEVTRMLLDRGAYRDSAAHGQRCMYIAIKNTSSEMIKALLPYDSVQLMAVPADLLEKYLCAMMPIQQDQYEEARAIQCLSLLRDWTTEDKAFEKCFRKNAERSCSIAIAEYLLRNGMDINNCPVNGSTALYAASRTKSRHAAEFMKFLLESGADPKIQGPKQRVPVADRPGPRNISKWLGVSWEQLVEESGKKHAASLQMKAQ